MLVPDWRVTGGESGVGGELGARRERGAVTDLGEDPCSGPGADPRQADQDRSERVCEEDLFDLRFEGVAAVADSAEFDGELGDDAAEGRFGGNRDGLFTKRLPDPLGDRHAHAR